MNKLKKIVLSLSIVFTMLIAMVVGFVGSANSKGDYAQASQTMQRKVYTRPKKVTSYTYDRKDIEIIKGGNNIGFSYEPSVNSTSAEQDEEESTPVKAYEYVFQNTMQEATAVNLKAINANGVNVSYAWNFDEPLSDAEAKVVSKTNYETQVMQTYGKKVYIYILVTPTNLSVPTNFNSNVVWYYGKPKYLPITNSTTNESMNNQVVVDGQEVEAVTINEPELSDEMQAKGYYFDGYFLDKEFTQPLQGTIKYNQQLYARFANVPLNSDYFTELEDGTFSLTASAYSGTEIMDDIVVPAYCGESVVSTIAPHVFYQNWGEATVYLPHTITKIDNESFWFFGLDADLTSCVNLEYIGNDAFAGGGGGVNIDFTKLTKLKTIESNAFVAVGSSVGSTLDLRNCTELKTIGTCVWTTESSTITSVLLPDSVTSIGDSAFCGNNLTELPDNLEYLGSNNISLNVTSLVIPANLKEVSGEAFKGCYRLVEIYNLSTLTITPGEDGSANGYAGTYAKVVHTDINEPTRITTIDDIVYCKVSNTSYLALDVVDKTKTTYTLNPNTTSVTGFAGCTNLTSIEIPSSVTEIGESAFSGCSSLESVKVSTNITIIKDKAFRTCKKLVDIDLKNCTNLTTIGIEAFGWCEGLTSIVIPVRVSNIGTNAFISCIKLVEVYDLSTSLTITAGSTANGYVGNYAKGIHTSSSTKSKLVEIEGVLYYKESDTSYIAISLVDKTKYKVTLHQNTTSVARYAFYHADIVSVVIPESVKSISSDAFYGCNGLYEIYNLSKNLTINKGDYSNNGAIGHYAKVVHTSINEQSRITVIDGVVYYKESETSYKALELIDKTKTELILPANVTGLAGFIFENCTNLVTVVLPESLTGLPQCAFSGCINLKNLTLSKGLKSIGEGAFRGCSSLTNIYIPNTVTMIAGTAFQNCTNLKTVYNASNLNIIKGETTFGNIARYADNVYKIN